MHHLFPGFPAGRHGAALLVLRIVVGLAFMLHGWPKVNDIAGFAAKSQVPWILGAAAALSEFVGGFLLILGLLTPAAAFFIGVTMAVALFKVHLAAGHPFVAPQGGPNFELAAVYLAIMGFFLLEGPGAYSLDSRLFRRFLARRPLPAP